MQSQNDKNLLPKELETNLESIAEKVHETWMNNRIKEGWTYGKKRDDNKKTHPCIVPYNKLPESEKEYDRDTARRVIIALIDKGFIISKKWFFNRGEFMEELYFGISIVLFVITILVAIKNRRNIAVMVRILAVGIVLTNIIMLIPITKDNHILSLFDALQIGSLNADYNDLLGKLISKKNYYYEIGRASCRERV